MKLNVRVSRGMMSPKAPFGQIEQYVIRIPDHLRRTLSLEVGQTLYLKTIDDGNLVLTVYPALGKDEWYDNESAFVVKRVFDRINLENKKKTESNLKPIEGGVSLGCDPEFLIVDRAVGKAIPSNSIIGGGTHSKIGSDHGLVEIRPDPAMDEETLVENMKFLLTGARTKLDTILEGAALRGNKSWYAGKDLTFEGRSAIKSYKDKLWFCGFHLHFGLHPKLRIRKKNTNYRAVLAFLASTVMVLDYFVAIPAIIPEGDSDSVRRVTSEFGNPGDFKHNKFFTLEYRVPGGHHMRSPMLARGLIGLGGLVVEDVMTKAQEITKGFTRLSKLSSYTKMRELYPQLPDYKVLKLALTAKDVSIAKDLYQGLVPQLEHLVSYEKRKGAIAPFVEYISSGDYNISANIEDNWSKL
jgi:hypothetical protein